jgi:hypothetical protein
MPFTDRRGSGRKAAIRSLTGAAMGMLLALQAATSQAATVTYTTLAGGTQEGQPVSAAATFTTGAGTVQISLTNLLANPTGVIQNISDLLFTLSTGQDSGTLTSSSGTSIMIDDNGVVTGSTAVSSTDWTLTTQGSSLYLDVLGPPDGPAQTIIGQPGPGGVYTNANGSIAGNGPHNPFLQGTVHFTLAVAGVTAATTVTGATFSFGTAAGNDTPGIQAVPEPSTLALVASALVPASLAGLRRLRRSRVATA